MQPTTYTFKTVLSSWGVYITVTAEAVPFDVASLFDAERCKEIAENLWFEIGQLSIKLSSTEDEFLRRGIELTSKQILSATNGSPTKIKILDVEFSECDYQQEALANATAGWAAQRFDFETPDYEIRFDRENNRYEFSYPS